MTTSAEQSGHLHTSDAVAERFAIDTYREWVAGEGVPTAEDFAVNLLETPVGRWERFDANGAVINVKGRGDYLDLWLIEVPPGGSTAPVHHLFEAVAYVVSGRGSAVVDLNGEEHGFEWGPRSMFALPLNATYRFHNGSGSEPARIAMTTAFPMLINVFRNEEFIFGSDFVFPERYGAAGAFEGKGRAVRDGDSELYNSFWETNFVPDLRAFSELTPLEWRGKGSTSIMFLLAGGVLHAHCSEIPVRRYKMAHRHIGGTHIYPVNGPGYSLLWFEGDVERIRVDWDHGWVYSPPDNMYHQHFNLADIPSRYFAVKLGNRRYPITNRMRNQFAATPETLKTSKDQIRSEDEDPEIRRIYEAELARRGMGASR